jgi:hypothetical protein
VLTDGYGSLEGPSLPFLQDDFSGGGWSTDLLFYAYGENDSCYRLPWLNAGCDALVQRKIGMGFELDASHVSKYGIVAQHSGKRSSTSLQPITASDVTKAFLKGHQIDYTGPSSPGLAMERIIEMLGGIRGCDLFKNAAINAARTSVAGFVPPDARR